MAIIKHESDKNISALMSDNAKQMEKYKVSRKKQKDSSGEVSWIIYYYLLSISHYNYDESHRFVYKNEFNVSELARKLEFSRPYFYTVVDKLKKQGLLRMNHDEDVYIIPITSTSVQINQEIFQALLGYAPILGIDLLKTYLFLCIVNNKGKRFTRRNIVKCLGHDDTGEEFYKRVDIYLDLFEKWELVYFRKNAKTDKVLGTFNEYSIEKLNKNSAYLEKQLEERKKESQNCFGLTDNEVKEIENILN